MKTKKLLQLGITVLLTGTQWVSAQDREANVPPAGTNFCRTTEVMEEYYKVNPQAKIEHEALEAFTKEYVKSLEGNTNSRNPKVSAVAKYRIPVVFHVYGNNFWGKKLTDAQIIAEIKEINKDFQGLQSDYATVNSNFSSIKSTMDISFELAKKDPSGNPTNGIDRKTTSGAGYGNGNPPAQLAKDAWNNKKYMNVYIVADLYNDGGSTNSGVAWYPDVSMTNSNTARVCQNGQYVGSNTSAEFRSVLTHEFGHFMNLAHTFDTGCNGTGDGVSDTPNHSSTSLNCPTSTTSKTPISDCGNWVINAENFMDYNGAFSCYKNFTKGQVARMEAALNKNDVTRFPLWQKSNLVETGLEVGVGTDINDNTLASISLYPNPNSGIFKLDISGENAGMYQLTITDVVGKSIYSGKFNNDNMHVQQIDISGQPAGIYFISVANESGGRSVKKIVKQQ